MLPAEATLTRRLLSSLTAAAALLAIGAAFVAWSAWREHETRARPRRFIEAVLGQYRFTAQGPPDGWWTGEFPAPALPNLRGWEFISPRPVALPWSDDRIAWVDSVALDYAPGGLAVSKNFQIIIVEQGDGYRIDSIDSHDAIDAGRH